MAYMVYILVLSPRSYGGGGLTLPLCSSVIERASYKVFEPAKVASASLEDLSPKFLPVAKILSEAISHLREDSHLYANYLRLASTLPEAQFLEKLIGDVENANSISGALSAGASKGFSRSMTLNLALSNYRELREKWVQSKNKASWFAPMLVAAIKDVLKNHAQKEKQTQNRKKAAAQAFAKAKLSHSIDQIVQEESSRPLRQEGMGIKYFQVLESDLGHLDVDSIVEVIKSLPEETKNRFGHSFKYILDLLSDDSEADFSEGDLAIDRAIKLGSALLLAGVSLENRSYRYDTQVSLGIQRLAKGPYLDKYFFEGLSEPLGLPIVPIQNDNDILNEEEVGVKVFRILVQKPSLATSFRRKLGDKLWSKIRRAIEAESQNSSQVETSWFELLQLRRAMRFHRDILPSLDRSTIEDLFVYAVTKGEWASLYVQRKMRTEDWKLLSDEFKLKLLRSVHKMVGERRASPQDVPILDWQFDFLKALLIHDVFIKEGIGKIDDPMLAYENNFNRWYKLENNAILSIFLDTRIWAHPRVRELLGVLRQKHYVVKIEKDYTWRNYIAGGWLSDCFMYILFERDEYKKHIGDFADDLMKRAIAEPKFDHFVRKFILPNPSWAQLPQASHWLRSYFPARGEAGASVRLGSDIMNILESPPWLAHDDRQQLAQEFVVHGKAPLNKPLEEYLASNTWIKNYDTASLILDRTFSDNSNLLIPNDLLENALRQSRNQTASLSVAISKLRKAWIKLLNVVNNSSSVDKNIYDKYHRLQFAQENLLGGPQNYGDREGVSFPAKLRAQVDKLDYFAKFASRYNEFSVSTVESLFVNDGFAQYFLNKGHPTNFSSDYFTNFRNAHGGWTISKIESPNDIIVAAVIMPPGDFLRCIQENLEQILMLSKRDEKKFLGLVRAMSLFPILDNLMVTELLKYNEIRKLMYGWPRGNLFRLIMRAKVDRELENLMEIDIDQSSETYFSVYALAHWQHISGGSYMSMPQIEASLQKPLKMDKIREAVRDLLSSGYVYWHKVITNF